MGFIDDFFIMHGKIIGMFGKPEELKNELLYSIHRMTSAVRYRDAIKEQFFKLFSQVMEYSDKQSKRPIRMAVQYIEKNYKNKISLNTVADEVELSPVYLSHIFKKETGENFIDYLNGYRIKAAKELLKETNMSVKEISWEVGFQDATYFSKLFKKIVGIKPAEYRKFYG